MYSGWSIVKYNNLMSDKKNYLLFPWYVAAWPWRNLLDSKPWDKLRLPWSTKSITINVDVTRLKSFSSHWDLNDLLYFLHWLKFRENWIIGINHWDEEAKISLLENIISHNIANRENVHIANSETKLSLRRPFDKWWTIEKTPLKKSAKTKEKEQEIPKISSEPEIDLEKFEEAIRIIVPNAGYKISQISIDRIHEALLWNMPVWDSFIWNSLLESKNPIVRDFMENPFKQSEAPETKTIDEVKPMSLPKLRINLKEIKERRVETLVWIVIIKINNKIYEWTIRNESGEIIYKTSESNIDEVYEEIKQCWIIPEWLQINKKVTNLKLTKEFYNKRLPTLEMLMKRKLDENALVQDFIELKFEEVWEKIVWKVYYKGNAILVLENSDKGKIISTLKRKHLISWNFRRSGDKIMLNESNMAELQIIMNQMSNDDDDVSVKPVKVKKPKTLELPKKIKNKISRTKKKGLSKRTETQENMPDAKNNKKKIKDYLVEKMNLEANVIRELIKANVIYINWKIATFVDHVNITEKIWTASHK